MLQKSNYIGGELCGSNKTFAAVNPSTEEVYGHFPLSTDADVHYAVSCARKVQPDWGRQSRVARADHAWELAQILHKEREYLQYWISTETGKSLNEAAAEIVEMVHMCQVVAGSGRQSCGEVYASEIADKDAYVIRKPRGVVAVISPWNFPLLGAFWCSLPAVVEGNTVVHKPSELTPYVNSIAAQLFQRAGFPNGIYNVVHGDGGTGEALVHSDVDAILFTGSAEVGRSIRRHCAETDKTCAMECGSKSAVVVFADGNLDLALDASVASAFKLSGQRCVSSGRILVERKVLHEFELRFCERLGDLTVGDPFSEPAPSMGPLISAEHRARVSRYNDMVRGDPDVRFLASGFASVPDKGFFLPPFVYVSEWADKPFLKEEVFGPHVAVVPFDTVDDAIRIHNDTPYGLAVGVVTDDFRKHRRFALECRAGMVYVNGGSHGAESHLPFSSWGRSGWGASAAATYKAVTHTTAVTVNYEPGKVTWAQGLK